MNTDFNKPAPSRLPSLGKRNPYIKARQEFAIARKAHAHIALAFTVSMMGISVALLWISIQTIAA